MTTRSGRDLRGSDADPSSYDGNKPTDEIEADIARTRARLGATITALEYELTPRRLIEKGVGALWASRDVVMARARKQIRNNPIPIALIATGAAWLFLLRLREDRAFSRTQASCDAKPDAVAAGNVPVRAPAREGSREPAEPVSRAEGETRLSTSAMLGQ